MKKARLIALAVFFMTSGLNAYAGITLQLKIFPVEYSLTINNKIIKTIPGYGSVSKVILQKGSYTLKFSAPGYETKEIKLELSGDALVEDKLEKTVSILKKVAEFQTGKQPKSVQFTPDGKHLAVALLEGPGVDIFSIIDMKKLKTIEFPAEYSAKQGFVETVFCRARNEMWVSQMHTDTVHVVDMEDFTYKRSVPTEGSFCKMLLFSDDESTLYVSNWLSKEISVIDAVNYKTIKRVPAGGTPRGMALSPDNKFLYVCIFDSDRLEKIDLAEGKTVKSIICSQGMRHVAADRSRNLLFASAMSAGELVVISMASDSVIKKISVGDKPNTVQLSPDKKTIFVSTRGPNNKTSYYLKGPEFGKIVVIDAQKYEAREWIWGRNQPTGLDVSPDGKYLVFTNFLDFSVEIYEIKY